ncbi:MAG: SMC-Scp complex subunit ScpB [Phycisphaerales bacterium]|nr:SMC-Scp complex subunit ScpB [Phycisphaerales bacterium]
MARVRSKRSTTEQVNPPVVVEAPTPPDAPGPGASPDPAKASSEVTAAAAQAPGQKHRPAVDPSHFAPTIEAVLLSTDKPLPILRLSAALGLIDEEAETTPAESSDLIREAIAGLNAQYESTSRSFRIELVAGGYRVMTRPEFAEAVARLHRTKIDGKLSRAALETLAIIAYRQPITRADLESIRGVACGEVLRSLMERRLVTITGRAEELGRPMLYGTTRQFLEAFGLATLKDLPTLAELKAP